MPPKFDAMASAKVFSGKPEETVKNLAMIKFPVLASVKWDGWRMFERNGEVLCRSMKPPKNRPTQKKMRGLYAAALDVGMIGIDGEALVGDPWGHNVISRCGSMFNSYENDEPFTYMVFDSYQHPTKPFEERLMDVCNAVGKLKPEFPWLEFCDHRLIRNMDELMEFLTEVEEKGGEGVMGRSINGPYKFGRSTMKEGFLWALKPYADDEAEIIGFDEMLENQNEATTNERGYTARSGHQENMVPKGTLGRFLCRSPNFGETFHVGMGVGLTFALRDEVWANREKFLGRWIKYKYQAVGVKDRPRQPKFMGFRSLVDMAARKSLGDGPAIINMKDA